MQVTQANSNHHWWRVAFDRYLFRKPQQTARRKFFSVVMFIVIGLILSFVISVSLEINGKSFFRMFWRVFANEWFFKNFIYQICIYVTAALAFSFAMRTGIFNIGISGQMLAGGSTAVLIIYKFPASANIVGGGQILTIVLAMIGGIAVALVTGALKVYLRINEVVSAIILNWIVLFIVGALVIDSYGKDVKGLDKLNDQLGTGNFGTDPDMLSKSSGYLFYQQNSGFAWSLGVTIVAVIIVWILMKYTVFGHKLKSTGLSTTAAKYFGYNDKVLQLASFAISGAIAGLLGAIVYTGQSQLLNFNSVGKTALTATPAEGFNGIAISLIGLNNPLAIVVVSIFFSFFSAGAQPAGLPVSTVSLVTGVMMYMIAIYVLTSYVRPWRWINWWRFGKMNSVAYSDRENLYSANTERYRFALLKAKKQLINTQPKNKRVQAWWILTFRWLFSHHVLVKKWRIAQQAALRAYFVERHAIEQEFQHACSYNLLMFWEHSLAQWHPHHKNAVALSTWGKARAKIVKWATPIADESIKASLHKHLGQIDRQINTLRQQVGGQHNAGR